MRAEQRVRAWRPRVPGVAEVFHAHFVEHAYPSHVHEHWTLLIVDDGAIRFDLDRHHLGAAGPTVTLLPPHVAHDGRAATEDGFEKRVVYLDSTVLDDTLIGAAVDMPAFTDALLRRRIDSLHTALSRPGDELEAESRLLLIRERLLTHLRPPPPGERPSGVADRLRDLLDDRVAEGITLREAGALLGAHPAHLVRVFSSVFGLPPHRYVTGRRIERARALLLSGRRPADVAVTVGFHDQAHMHRHFVRYVGVTPARYARSAGNGNPAETAYPARHRDQLGRGT